MTLAIMQPYIFPYIGYFQLIHAADKFVVYDDVNFIKQGWINRNQILLNGKEFLFTIPLADASSFKKINEVQLHKRLYDAWKPKFYKSLVQAYSKAPFFDEAFSLVKSVLDNECTTIAGLATDALNKISAYMGIDTIIIPTSTQYENNSLAGKERVVDICKREGADTYVNAPGGAELYPQSFFKNENIQLYFIKTKGIKYQQYGEHFVPNLSIIDVLMFNPKEKINELLNSYELV
jgi:hypothetical protein